MHRTTNAPRKLRLEPLEARVLLAGDVTVKVAGGNLLVQGDDADNHIAITQVAPGMYQVAATDDSTTINGQAVGTPFDAGGVNKNFIIRMGEGGDSVAMSDVHVPRELLVGLGGGDDTLEICDARVGGGAVIEAGDGNNQISIGACSDAPPDSNPNLEGVSIAKNLNIHTGDGDDDIAICDTRVGANLLIHTGDGMDDVALGSCEDFDPPPEFRVRVGHLLLVQMGDGDDTLALDRVKARMALLGTGAGNDQVTAHGSMADMVFAMLGDGDDVFDASGGNNTVRVFYLLGGMGTDTFKNAATNQAGHARFQGVENMM